MANKIIAPEQFDKESTAIARAIERLPQDISDEEFYRRCEEIARSVCVDGVHEDS